MAQSRGMEGGNDVHEQNSPFINHLLPMVLLFSNVLLKLNIISPSINTMAHRISSPSEGPNDNIFYFHSHMVNVCIGLPARQCSIDTNLMPYAFYN